MSLAPGNPPHPGPGRSRTAAAIVEFAAIGLLLAAGLATWGIGIVQRGYDYDEVQRAHSVWLASQGLRPYHEMFEVHPPYFILLTPILGLAGEPCEAILALRIFAAIGNLAFLAALVALGWERTSRGGRWAVLGVAFVAIHPRVVDYLAEYRIDGWGNAMAAWTVVLFLRQTDTPRRFATFGLLIGLATLMFSPKLAVLPPLLVGVALVQSRPGWRGAFRRLVAFLLGGGMAGLVFVLYLAANRIGVDRTYSLLFRYHTLSNANASFSFGLLEQVVATPALLGPIVLGVLATVVLAFRRGASVGPYLPALGAWLVIQSLMVAYPYKQYYAPWFLFASTFVVVLGRGVDRLWRPLGTLILVLACGATIVSTLTLAQLWQRQKPARASCAVVRVLNTLARPEDRVVAPPPEHPIFRRDTFFLWFSTSDPGGYDSGRILQDLDPFRDVVSVEQNREALRQHPPALVVLNSGPVPAPYPEGQWRALLEFLPSHGYRVVRVNGLRVALRPDRFEQFRGTGIVTDDSEPLAPLPMPAR